MSDLLLISLSNDQISGVGNTGLTEMTPAGEWLANFTSPATKAAYLAAVRDFTGFAGIGSAGALLKVTRGDVICWRDDLAGRGAQPRTIAARLSALSSLFDHFRELQLVARNPVEGVRRPNADQGKVSSVALSRDQVRKMLDLPGRDSVQGLRDSALLHVFFYTGCRVSEPCGLRVRDYSWDMGFRVLDFVVKGGKRNRVAIHPDVQHALDLYLAAAGHGDEGEAYLFRQVKHARAAPLHRSTLDQIFRKYGKLADLPAQASPHSARATFITEALERDHPAEAVQKTVAHADISTTLSYDKRDHHPRKSASFAVRY